VERQRQARKATHALLRQRWPRLFTGAAPLAIGIHNDIRAALSDQVSAKELRAFLAFWCRRRRPRKLRLPLGAL
jgi:sRNA-binding protein